MTVDELIALTESLLAGQTVESIRSGDSQPQVDDDQFVLLVRFLAGERPAPAAAPVRTPQRYQPVPIPDHLEHEDEVGPVNLDDLEEFQGVTLL